MCRKGIDVLWGFFRIVSQSSVIFDGALPQSVALYLTADVVDFFPIIFLVPFFNFFKQVISVYPKARSLSKSLSLCFFSCCFHLTDLVPTLKEIVDSHSLFTCSITFTSITYPASHLSPAEGCQLTLGSANPLTILGALLHFSWGPADAPWRGRPGVQSRVDYSSLLTAGGTSRVLHASPWHQQQR